MQGRGGEQGLTNKEILGNGRLLAKEFIKWKYGRTKHKIVEEMGLLDHRSRVDIAVISSYFIGYEVKASQDSFKRLPEQARTYNEVFDYIHLICTENHLKKLDEVPAHWGVIKAYEWRGQICFKQIVKPVRNPLRKKSSLLRMYWKDELVALLERHNILRGNKNKTKKTLCAIAFKNIEFKVIHDQLMKCIKQRDYKRK